MTNGSGQLPPVQERRKGVPPGKTPISRLRGAVKYGLANCQGFEQFGEDLSAWKMTADNLKSLGFH
jgi:hypothetical protein